MPNYELICHLSQLDEEYQYIEELNEQKQPMEIHGIQEEMIESQDEITLQKQPKILHSQAFDDPQYKNSANTSRTQKLANFLPKIVKQYEEEEKLQKIKQAQNEISQEEEDDQASSQMLQASHFHEQNLTVSSNSRSKKIKKEQYPTKNMLPSFKSSFLNYLSRFFPKEYFENIQIIRKIREKFGINLQDYEDLFKQQIFKPHLRRYFRNKVIYRDLFQSRIEYRTKRIYFEKLDIFQEAFTLGVFKGIN